jgi:RNA polymerase sigma factor (sigma-70 family)
MSDTHAVTNLLGAMQRGDDSAGRKLFELVYDELNKMAVGLMASERRKNHTWQPTALVHEAFVRLMEGADLRLPNNRRFFYFTAARAMRQLLEEHGRKYKTDKRGGKLNHVSGDDVLDGVEGHRYMHYRTGQYRVPKDEEDDILDGNGGLPDPGRNALVGSDNEHPWDSVLDQIRGQYGVGFGELADVIDLLAVADARAAEIVWLRFMGGMPMQEIGECLGISESEVDIEWRVAKKWLKDRLQGGQDE